MIFERNIGHYGRSEEELMKKKRYTGRHITALHYFYCLRGGGREGGKEREREEGEKRERHRAR